MLFRLLATFVVALISYHTPAVAQRTAADSTDLPRLLVELTKLRQASAGDSDSLLTFASALARTFSANPLVGASRAGVESAEGRLRQSQARLNPLLTIELEDFGRSNRGGVSQTTIGIEQPLELWGVRGARRRSAQASLRATEFEAQQLLLELFQQTGVAFSLLLGAQEIVANGERRLALTRQMQDAVAIKFRDGAVPESEVLRAKAETRLAEADLSRQRAELAQNREALAVLWGGTSDNLSVFGALDWWVGPLNVDSLIALLEENPQLQGIAANMAADEARVRLARSLGKPDVTLGGGYRWLHDDDDKAFLVWVSMPLPFFDRNGGGTQEAIGALERSQSELEATRRRTSAELRQLIVALDAQQTEMNLIRNEVLPPAEAALRAIDEAYRLGSQPYINVLDARRSLTEIQLRLVESQVAGAIIATNIERLTGRLLTRQGVNR